MISTGTSSAVVDSVATDRHVVHASRVTAPFVGPFKRSHTQASFNAMRYKGRDSASGIGRKLSIIRYTNHTVDSDFKFGTFDSYQKIKFHVPIDGPLQQFRTIFDSQGPSRSTSRTKGSFVLLQPFAPDGHFTQSPPVPHSLLHLRTPSLR